MADPVSQMERLVSLLGGWPEHFSEKAERFGESILQVLVARRTIDQAVFGLVVRYAEHRAAFDRLSQEIAAEDFEASAANYLSGKEQRRAFHENRLAALETQLLATPYARAKSGEKVQTDFLALLDESPDPDDGGKETPDADGKRRIVPFEPIARKGRGSGSA
ncbi:hypothetical protein [Roseovarius sp. MMSF_3350]|uniref:hypothetical protein n=1 Tax=Roseovarius sp. MMSF_3350 TaxID=3046706 RepID=UPI00273DC4AE|nr:hypothetical protein [Roseovarius sp. MMSF_3350]